MKELTGKWALITGSSRGIGRQIALGLAECGCNIVVHGRRAEHTVETSDLLRRFSVDQWAVHGDLADRDTAGKIAEQIHHQLGGVDILYNNAAIMNEWREIWDIPSSAWREVFEVNLFAVVSLCRALVPAMIQKKFGRIINVASGIKDIPQLAPYSVSKAAVDKFTQDLAAELSETDVLVNGLDPGWLKTDMGGEAADFEVETVLPGALVPALIGQDGPRGKIFAAQDFKCLQIRTESA